MWAGLQKSTLSRDLNSKNDIQYHLYNEPLSRHFTGKKRGGGEFSEECSVKEITSNYIKNIFNDPLHWF